MAAYRILISMNASRATLALVLTLACTATVACSGEDADPTPTTTTSGSTGTAQSAESTLTSACSEVINNRSAEDLPEDFGATTALAGALMTGEVPDAQMISEATADLRLRIDDREKALDALREPAAAVNGLDAWWRAWQSTADGWNEQISALDSGDADAMKSAFLGIAGESGAEFPEAVQDRTGSHDCAQVFTLVPPEDPDTGLYRQAASMCTAVVERRFGEGFHEDAELIFREVTRPVLTREDLPEITAGIRDAAGRIATEKRRRCDASRWRCATEKRRTADELGELNPTVSTALDPWGAFTGALDADAARAESRADALDGGDSEAIVHAFSPVRRDEDPLFVGTDALDDLGLGDRDCARLFA